MNVLKIVLYTLYIDLERYTIVNDFHIVSGILIYLHETQEIKVSLFSSYLFCSSSSNLKHLVNVSFA